MTREEAIKELRGFIWQLTEGCQEAIKVLIPELKESESEDEKIRKKIVSAMSYYRNDGCISEYEFGVCRNWLEKQKEQKPEWSEEDEDKLRDILEMIKYTDALPPMDIPSCTGHLHLSNEYKEKLSSWLKTQLKSLNPQPKVEEEPVDLEKEIDKTVSECANGYNFDWERFALYFYKLGLNNTRKEK